MLLAICPRCESQYMISNLNVSPLDEKVKICLHCGFTNFTSNFKEASFFEKSKIDKQWPLTCDMIRVKFFPLAKEEVLRRAFYGGVTAEGASLLLGAYSFFGCLTGVHISQLDGRPANGTIRIAPTGNTLFRNILFSDSYFCDRLYITDTIKMAMFIRYYTTMCEGVPANVLCAYDKNKATTNKDYFRGIPLWKYADPKEIIVIGTKYLVDRVSRSDLKVNMACIINAVPEPFYIMLRLLEERFNENYSNNVDNPIHVLVDYQQLLDHGASLNVKFEESGGPRRFQKDWLSSVRPFQVAKGHEALPFAIRPAEAIEGIGGRELDSTTLEPCDGDKISNALENPKRKRSVSTGRKRKVKKKTKRKKQRRNQCTV